MEDLNLLTPHFAQASISDKEIVLDYPRIIEAIHQLTAAGYAVTGWEGWLLYSDGKKGHSARFQGTVPVQRLPKEDIQPFAKRVADFVRSSIEHSQAQWDQLPEYVDVTLYYCLTIET